MKLKSKPKAPERKEIRQQVGLQYDIVVFDIVMECFNHMTQQGYTAEEAKLLSDRDITLDYNRGYYDEVELVATFNTTESDESWYKRVAAYDQRMEEYNTWLTENADDIAVEIAAREVQQKIDFRVKTQAKVDKLADQLAREHKRLKTL